jgi:hypothetical protein
MLDDVCGIVWALTFGRITTGSRDINVLYEISGTTSTTGVANYVNYV